VKQIENAKLKIEKSLMQERVEFEKLTKFTEKTFKK